MRILMWLSLGFAAACAFCAYLYGYTALAWLLLALAAVGALGGLLWKRKGKRLAVFLLGFFLGLCWWQLFDNQTLAPVKTLDGQTRSVSMTASDYGYDTAYGCAVDGKIKLEGKTYSVKIYLNEKVALHPGDSIHGIFRFRYTGVGGAKPPTFHRGEGMFLLAYPAGESTVEPGDEAALRYLPARLRLWLQTTLDALFPKDTAAFARGLLLGDSSGFSYELETAFSVSGIRHVIAVSGLHVSILFSFVCLITGNRRVLCVLLGVPVLALFAAMAGLTPSIVRACIMQALMLLALLCKKEYDPPTALAFAALVMLLVNPYTVTSVSFQLSAGSMVGIFLFSGKLRGRILKFLGGGKGKSFAAKRKRWLAGSVSVTLGAMSVTAPLAAWYFGAVSLIGVLTNLLTLWVITFIFCGCILACGLSLFSFTAGRVTAYLVAIPIRFVLNTARSLASFPMAAVYTQSKWIVVWLVFVYALFFLMLLLRKKQLSVFACLSVISLVLALLLSWTEPLLDSYRMTVLDVGQGQCILLQSEGRTYMVDCGGDNGENTADIAAEWLLSQGIPRLDGIILSHYDADHANGAEYLLTRVSADTVLLPRGKDPNGYGDRIKRLAQTHTVTEDVCLTFGETKITVFASENTSSSNESSLCVLFQTPKCDILITGDRSVEGELALLGSRALPDLEVLVAGHHGAPSSTGTVLLAVTKPETLVISVGADNSYSHPAQTVLDRAAEAGCTVRRTDLEGTILIRG